MLGKRVPTTQPCVFSGYNTNAMELYQPPLNCKTATSFAISVPGKFTCEPGTRVQGLPPELAREPGLWEIVSLVLGEAGRMLGCPATTLPHGSPWFPTALDASH